MKSFYITILVIATLIAVLMTGCANAAGCDLVRCIAGTVCIEDKKGNARCVPTCKSHAECGRCGFCLKNKKGSSKSCYYRCWDKLCIQGTKCKITGRPRRGHCIYP